MIKYNVDNYEYIRINNPHYKFSRSEIKLINEKYNDGCKFNNNHSILNKGEMPGTKYHDKPTPDSMAVALWNTIFGGQYSIKHLNELKFVASKYIEDSNLIFPNGVGMLEEDTIRYITAFSASSFIGIQNPNKSSEAMKSMIKTLKAHSNPRIVYKPWLIENIKELKYHIASLPFIMDRDYGDMCMAARNSSSSIPGMPSFRDFVFELTFEEILSMKEQIPFLIFLGVRIDRRGKFRLICSFDARFRIIDFMLNNGSYDLFSHGGIYSKYTTEGYNNKMMWLELAKMSSRGEWTMVCLDYEGYDTQISTYEYLAISNLINHYRKDDPLYGPTIKWFNHWMMQPKALVSRSGNEYEMLIPFYKTLPSGMHATHSFENAIGVSTYFEAIKRGIKVGSFKSNGDDQNVQVFTDHIDRYMEFIKQYFLVSESKSLIGHDLSVWGKLWFSRFFHPMWEIGTFRSIWEKEGGSVETVEPSKFESNYCKILQVLITLIRMNKPMAVVRYWMWKLCDMSDPKIDPTKIPTSLHTLENFIEDSSTRRREPKGLKSSKGYLMSKNFDLNLITVNNYYNMLLSMFRTRQIFSLDLKTVHYHPRGTELRMQSSFDYSCDPSKNVPFALAKLYKLENLLPEQNFVRSVLQGTKSYDGPVLNEYKFFDMMSLALCIDKRNKDSWKNLIDNN